MTLEAGQTWVARTGRHFVLIREIRPRLWEWRCGDRVGASYGWTIQEKCELKDA